MHHHREFHVHVIVNVNVLLQEVLDLTAGRAGEVRVGMGLVEDSLGLPALRW